MRFEALSPDNLPILDELITRFPYNPYRHYRILSRRRQADVLRALIRQPAEGGIGTAFVASSRGSAGPHAACLLRQLDWETEFFGLPMGRLESMLGSDANPEALRGLLGTVVAEARAQGVVHLAARVDIADCRTVHMPEDLGFRLMDTLVTYIYGRKERRRKMSATWDYRGLMSRRIVISFSRLPPKRTRIPRAAITMIHIWRTNVPLPCTSNGPGDVSMGSGPSRY